MADYKARMKQEAESRRNLEGNTLFEDLGEPIQKLLQAVSKDITNEELQLFSKISVRLLAKVYDMLSSQEDPDKILAWLQQQVRLQNKENKDDSISKRAARDPIAFYKELEKKNQEMLDSFSKAESEREALRKANLAERELRRQEAEKKAALDRERAAKNGETTDAVERMKKEDVADITNAFDRFTAKQSTFDNSNSVGDTEWWKKDEYRRDFEKNKRKGKLWTRVVEGGTQTIPDSELQAREEWFKSFTWWKSDKFRRDWLASREAEWWKEETYIRDWQDKGDKGTAWLAADEITGFNRKGHRRPAAKAELERRTQWYKDNGPKGIVKMWCALTEGASDRCTLEEKRERDDYYKNGDWWKADGYVRKALDNISSCDGLRKAGAAAADGEWWKAEEYRKDFKRGGKKWQLASEKAAVTNDADAEATEAEMERREEWFSKNWWKSDELVADFKANGDNGTLWKAASEADLSKGAGAKIPTCSAAEGRAREEWFRSADDRDWWKDEVILRDWELNGRAGKKWTAAWREAALDSTGDKNRASEEELVKREQYYDKNWWKANKYVKDFQGNGSKGTAWKASDKKGHEDKDWWKGDNMQKQWFAARQAGLEQFWQRPDIIEDYWKNAAMGKKWTAANASAAEGEMGDNVRASAEDLAKREGFFQENWWRAPDFQRDFAANGKHGKLWQAANPDGTGGEATKDELKRRKEFFRMTGKGKHVPGFNAMLEADAVDARAGSKFTKFNRIVKRDEHFKNNWWKTNPEVRADFESNGEKSSLLKAATLEAAAAGLGDRPEFQASSDQIKERIAYFQSGEREDTNGDNWWKDAAFAKEWAAGRQVPFWQNTEFIADFLDNGHAGKKWTGKTPTDGSMGLGSAGSSLKELADKLGVPVAELQAANPSIKDINAVLSVGSMIANPKRSSDHTVEQLAAKIGVSVNDLVSANDSLNSGKDALSASQPLTIPVTAGGLGCAGSHKKFTLKEFADKLGVPVAELQAANPSIKDINAALNLGSMIANPKRNGDHTVEQLAAQLGVSVPDLVCANDSLHNGKDVLTASQHLTIPVTTGGEDKTGDSLNQIADKLGVTVSELQAANSWITDANTALPVGAVVSVPKRGEDATIDQLASQLGQAPMDVLAENPNYRSGKDVVPKGQNLNVIVSPHATGDSLNQIADKLGVAVSELQAANSWVKDVNTPLPAGSVVANPQRGDDLTADQLASKLGVPTANLFSANDSLRDGKVLPKKEPLNIPVVASPSHRASDAEIAARADWLKKNFWKAPKYNEDFETNGEKGTLWTMSEPDGKGEPVSEKEMNARQAWFRPVANWQLAEKPNEQEKGFPCDMVEAIDRDEWFKKNWWKGSAVRDDFEANGRKSKLLRAINPEAITLGLQDDPLYQASPEEVEERAQYFETCADNEWWQAPVVVADFVKWDKEGAVWQSRNFKESQLSMGMENPAPQEELDGRSAWFESNYWKTPEAITDFQQNGNKGSVWKAGRDGVTAVPASEVATREAWFKKNFTVDKDEETRRKNWYLQQLTDEETAMRRSWVMKKGDEGKRIHPDELKDLLAQINDGMDPSDEQVQMVMSAVQEMRSERTGEDDVEIGEDGISQEEFVTAVANTNFYVSATDEERLRAEQEALDALQREEMERQDEVAGHLAMEAQEELDNAGFEEHEEVDEDDEAAFLDEMDEADLENRVNEDDDDVDEGAWETFLQQNEEDEEGEYTEEQLAELQREEEERMAAEAAQAEAEAAAWDDEEIGGEEGEDDGYENPADLDADAKEELEAVVNEDWDENEYEEELEEEEEIDEMMEEEKGAPMQWKLPLPEVTNPQYLKAYFTVIKYTPSHSFLGGKQKRVWVVDHFTRCFYNLEKSGKIKKEHAANKLLQLERNIVDSNRLRLMFFDASHSYELQFFNARERERFFESASAIRPSIRVYAPDLTNQDANVEACTTTIDGVAANSVSVVCSNAAGKPVKRELTGECKINASKLLTEPLTVWTGTFNLSGQRPPRNKAELAAWLPKDKHDIYAIAVQEASYRKEENEWFDYIQAYLGRDYLTLASMNLWDTLLIVLTRKKHLLKITNVEGSTKATIHKAVCGPKGGIGISLRYLETSMCFVTCHLSSRIERTAMRNTNLEEIVDNLQLGIRETDLYNQFNHVFFFGDFNYRTEVDVPTAENMIQNESYAELLAYDQFSKQREEGLLYGFEESPITFAPTYRLQPGTGKYMAEKGNASSYCDRVLTRSMANTWVKCTSYKSIPQLTFSEHSPVAATFIVRCVRPVLSCFAKQQQPQPTFKFKQIKVTGNNVVISKPRLMLFSPFFGNNKPFDSKVTKNANPIWNAADVPPLEAVSQVQPFLESGHIVFIIREGAEKREEKGHRGSGSLPLFNRIIGQESTEQEFEVDLINHGRKCGTISGAFTWFAGK